MVRRRRINQSAASKKYLNFDENDKITRPEIKQKNNFK